MRELIPKLAVATLKAHYEPLNKKLFLLKIFLISAIFSLELRRPVAVGAMDDFERRCLRKKRQVFVERVEISAELLENMKAKGLLNREHVEHILVRTIELYRNYKKLVMLVIKTYVGKNKINSARKSYLK